MKKETIEIEKIRRELEILKNKLLSNKEKIMIMENKVKNRRSHKRLLRGYIDDLELKREKIINYSKNLKNEKKIRFGLSTAIYVITLLASLYLTFININLLVMVIIINAIVDCAIYSIGLNPYFEKKEFLKNNNLESIEIELNDSLAEEKLNNEEYIANVKMLEELKKIQENLKNEMEDKLSLFSEDNDLYDFALIKYNNFIKKNIDIAKPIEKQKRI